jgi:S-adenosylmethionine hydrolase
VIAGICPDAHVIDLTHGVPRHDVRGGALNLAGALPYLPVGVHLAVVDPDVGASRRAVALGLGDGRRFVGPDNGLLWPAASSSGGIIEAVDIAHSRFRLEPVSATFHGRDIFAPVAAHLACGAKLADAGEPVDPEELVRLELTRPSLGDETVLAHVMYIDRFGNIQLDAVHEDLAGASLRLGRAVEITDAAGRRHPGHFARTFADVGQGELLVYEDGSRRLAVAESQGDAAGRLGLRVGDELRISST